MSAPNKLVKEGINTALLLKPIIGKIDILFALLGLTDKANKISIFPIMGFKSSALLLIIFDHIAFLNAPRFIIVNLLVLHLYREPN